MPVLSGIPLHAYIYLFVNNVLQLGNALFQDIHGDVQRRQETHEAIGRQHQDTLFDALADYVLQFLVDDLDANHEAHTRYVVDVFALFQFFFDVFPFFSNFCHKVVVEAVDDGNAASRANRVAAKGRAMGMISQGMLRRIGEHRSP